MPRTALIVVDMLNAYDHDDAEDLARSVEQVLPAMAGLIDRARDEAVPTIYVNDNFGSWTSNRDALVEQVLSSRFRRLVEPIAPRDDTPFVVKGRHSIFYQTPLELLLAEQGVERLVLIGQVTEQCILYSALDAYLRRLEVVVPRDAVAHIHEDLAGAALRMMEVNMAAEIADAGDVRFSSSASMPGPIPTYR